MGGHSEQRRGRAAAEGAPSTPHAALARRHLVGARVRGQEGGHAAGGGDEGFLQQHNDLFGSLRDRPVGHLYRGSRRHVLQRRQQHGAPPREDAARRPPEVQSLRAREALLHARRRPRDAALVTAEPRSHGARRGAGHAPRHVEPPTDLAGPAPAGLARHDAARRGLRERRRRRHGVEAGARLADPRHRRSAAPRSAPPRGGAGQHRDTRGQAVLGAGQRLGLRGPKRLASTFAEAHGNNGLADVHPAGHGPEAHARGPLDLPQHGVLLRGLRGPAARRGRQHRRLPDPERDGDERRRAQRLRHGRTARAEAGLHPVAPGRARPLGVLLPDPRELVRALHGAAVAQQGQRRLGHPRAKRRRSLLRLPGPRDGADVGRRPGSGALDRHARGRTCGARRERPG
mmetsp:Transcript_19231/g.51039  ORF Transcript_19231/g.51039 Transcript_19231/m.51039 type:complete len:401 (-) Transcript_19231:188-1390(-)